MQHKAGKLNPRMNVPAEDKLLIIQQAARFAAR